MAHTHTIVDHDDHFIIDPVTRKIHPEVPKKSKLVRHDHKSERYTFEIPRMIEDHDMILCDSVRIHYLNVSTNNIESSAGVYDVADMGTLADDADTAAFSWLVDNGSTMYAGVLNFAIEFRCLDGDRITYAWHTEIYSSIGISDVISNDDAFTEEYYDVFEAWKNELLGVKTESTQEIEAAGEEQIIRIERKGNDVLASIPEDYTTLSEVISKGYAKSPVTPELNSGELWVRSGLDPSDVCLMDASQFVGTPTGFDSSKCVAARVRVTAGETYYIKASKLYFDDPTFATNVTEFYVVGAGLAEDVTPPGGTTPVYVYPILQEYAPDVPVATDGSFTVVVPNDVTSLLINTCEADSLEVMKLRPTSTIIDLTDGSYDNLIYYPVTGSQIPRGGLHKIHVYSTFNDGAHPSWATNDSGYTCNMEVYDKGQSWGQTDGATIATDYSWKHADGKPCGYFQMTHSSIPVVLLRGGGIYHVETDFASEWTVHTTEYTYMSDMIRPIPTCKFDFTRATIFANLDGEIVGGNGSGWDGTGDISQATVAFTEDSGYEIATGENTATLFGKIKKLISTIKSKAPYFLTAGRVPSADKLYSAKNIDGFTFNGTSAIKHYVECSTAGDIARKEIAVGNNFTVSTGSILIVKFAYANTATNPELMITGHGFAPIYYHGAAIPANYICENSILAFTYASGAWEIIGKISQSETQEATSGIKSTVSGTVIDIQDSSDAALSGLRIFGKTDQIVTSGKNLFNVERIYDKTVNGVTFKQLGDGKLSIKGTTTTSLAETETVPLNLSAGTYAIALNSSDPALDNSAVSFMLSYEHNGTRVWKKDIAEIIEGDTNLYAYISVNKGVTLDIVVFPQIELGSTPTDPEPYTDGVPSPNHLDTQELRTAGYSAGCIVISVNQSQTFNLNRDGGLPGIKVSSGGNYTDETGQEWVCDEVDLAKGIYIRRIKRVNLGDLEGWVYEAGYGGFALTLEDANYDVIPMCSMYICGDSLSGIENERLAISAGIHGILIRNDDFNNVEDWVAALGTSDYSAYMQYALRTPEEIPLDSDTLATYKRLHTTYPSTTIENDAGAHMEVTYTVDMASYVLKLEDRIAALEQKAISS